MYINTVLNYVHTDEVVYNHQPNLNDYASIVIYIIHNLTMYVLLSMVKYFPFILQILKK